MRIVYFTETFLPKIDGIVTRLTRTLEQLHDLGHEALIFAPPQSAPLPNRVVNVPSISFRPWYPELMLDAQSLFALTVTDCHAVNLINLINEATCLASTLTFRSM